jgi:hypothetical protein
MIVNENKKASTVDIKYDELKYLFESNEKSWNFFEKAKVLYKYADIIYESKVS